MRKKLIGALVTGLLIITGTAQATIIIGGGLGDWGINPANGLRTDDSVGNPKTGLQNGVYYWEEKGAIDPWGYVSPGYGGYAYDIQGLYFTSDSAFMYVAAIVGMPPGGFNGGSWNGQTWLTQYHETMGDIAIKLDASSYNYGIETLGGNAGKVYDVTVWTDPADYPTSKPVDIETGTANNTLTFQGLNFAYELLPGYSDLYYIEAKFNRPAGFSGDISLHLTQTCGNDVADLAATVAPVPEPATMLLFGAGLAGLAGGIRLRKAKGA